MRKLWGVLPLTPLLFSVSGAILSSAQAEDNAHVPLHSILRTQNSVGAGLVTSRREGNDSRETHPYTFKTMPSRVMKDEEVHSTTIAQAMDDPLSQSPMDQVTPVSQLSDVQPTDWAFQALQSLVERYGCIVGYPDRTYRGDRALTRFEFAAALNACLNRVSERITAGLTDGDLDQLQRLQREFSPELEILQSQVNLQEERIAYLERTQFSTTTRLVGEVDIDAVGVFGDQKAVPSGESPTEDLDDTHAILAGRALLAFDTSFTGRDLLRTKIEAGNINGFRRDATGTDMTASDFGTNTGNDFKFGSIFYRFPLGDRGLVNIVASGQGSNDIVPTLNPVSSLSAFAARNPIYRLSGGGGAGVYYQFTDQIGAGAAYFGDVGSISNPESDFGLFNGQFGALAQITFTPTDNFGVGLTYARYYSPQPGATTNVTGGTGSQFAQLPFGEDTATAANAYGIEAGYRFSDRFVVGGWVGYTHAIASSASPQGNDVEVSGDADADIWNWAITAAVLDLGKLGSQLGFAFGMPPKLTENDVANRRDRDTSYHIELFYRYPLSDRIFITPGIFVITNPEHNHNNDSLWLWAIRTTFVF